MDPAALGALLLLLGVIISLITWFILRVLARTQGKPVDTPLALGLPVDLARHSDAVLGIEPGGRILYINARARDWFNLNEREPHLEQLARQARPGHVFLNLCSEEGQARLTLNNRYLEATSYRVPSLDYGRIMVVILRHQSMTTLTSGDGSQAGRALGIFTELTQRMASSLELDTTMQAILESVERLIPCDFSEITIWEAGSQELVPFRFVGLAGVDRRMERTSDRYRAGEGYSGYLITKRQPLLVNDVDAPNDVHPYLDRQKYPFRSYLGAPLLAGQELVGTVELASFDKARFNDTDLETLLLLAGQAAVALHNALLFEQEQQQARELAGLARLVQATSSISDPDFLFSRLVDSLQALFQVERLGFLLYDEQHRLLVCQAPFIGIPPEVVQLYQVAVPEGGPADHVVRSQDMVIAQAAPTHPALISLGINQIAEAAGMRDTILVPLTSTGSFLGYLQVANKSNRGPFGDDDIRLLAIVAGQIGPLLGNARMIQETRRRAQRSEALRRISNLAGSAATLDEILRYSLQELQRMLEAQIAAIYLVDEQAGELRVHAPSVSGVDVSEYPQWASMPLDSPDFPHMVTSTQQSYLARAAGQDERILPFFRELVARLNITSLVSVPLVIRDRGVGELVLASHSGDAFDQSDLVFAATAAGQLAGAVERSILYSQTDENLRRRVDELTALTVINRELNVTRDLKQLIARVHDEALRATQADGGRTVLLEPGHLENRELFLVHGQANEQPLHPLERQVLENGQSLLVTDLSGQADPPLAPLAHAAVLAPVQFAGQVAGVIHLWASQPETFDAISLEIVQTISVQVSIGFTNALNYQQQSRQNELLIRRVETLGRLLEVSRSQQLSQPVEKSLEAIAEAIREATPFNAVLISVFEADKKILRRTAGAGFAPDQVQEMSRFTQPWPSVQEYFQDQYRFGQSYFIPTEKKPVDPPDIHTVYVLPPAPSSQDATTWHPDDLLLTPLFNASGQPLGLISVDDPRNGLRPDRPTLETLEIFASQAVLTIESHMALRAIENQLLDARQRMERAEKSAKKAVENLPMLLHKDREQTLLLHSLSGRTRRIAAALDIAELVHQQVDRQEALQALATELLLHLEMDGVLVAEAAEGGPRLVITAGSVADPESLNSLLGQRNPLRMCMQNGEILLVPELAAEEDWQATALLQAAAAQAFVCFPVQGSQGVDAAVLLIRRTPLAAFEAEDVDLFRMLGAQTALALRNISLLAETSLRLQEVDLLLRFSQELGSLDPTSILDALIETSLKVAQNAQGGMVLLWDALAGSLNVRAAQGYPDSTALTGMVFPLVGSLPGRAFSERRTLRVDEVNFVNDYNLGQENLLRYQEAVAGRLPVSSLLVPIQSGDQPLGVLVLDDFRSAAGFSPEDQSLIDSLAPQTALALVNARLFQASEQRAMQLQSLTAAAGEMSANLQSDELIAGLLARLRSVTAFENATLWLRYGDQLTVMAVEGFTDREERIGLTVAAEDSLLLQQMITSGKPIVVDDVRLDERFPVLDQAPNLSWLGLPLIGKGDVIGVIALEKAEAGYYAPETIQVLTAFASQAAVSLQNAMLFDDSLRRALELDEQTQRLTAVNRFATALSSSLDISQILRTILSEIQRQVSCSAVSILLFNRLGQANVWAEAPQKAEQLPILLPEAQFFTSMHEAPGVYNGEAIADEPELAPLLAYFERHGTLALLAVPLVAGSELQGVVLVHEARRHRRFTVDEIDVTRTITTQAAISVQNAQLYEESRLRLNELAAINQISQNISATIDLQELFVRLPEQLKAIVATDNLYLALYDAAQDQVSFPIVYEGGERIELEPRPPAGLTGHIIQTGSPLLLVGDQVSAQLETLDAQQYGQLQARSYLGVPLMVGERVIGVIAVQSPDRSDAYTPDDVRLVSTVAAQIAVAIENSRLYTETRQRSADLALLFDFSTGIANLLDEARLVEVTFTHLQEAFAVAQVAVATREGESSWKVSLAEGSDRRTATLEAGEANLALQVAASGQALRAPLPPDPAELQAALGFESELPLAMWLGVPLMVRGEIFGVLSIAGAEGGPFNAEHLPLVSQIGNQLATALDSARLFGQVQAYATELELRVQERTQQLEMEHSRTETLLRIITELSASLDMDIVLNRTLGLINQIVGAEQSTILLVEIGEVNLLRRASFGYAKPAPEGGETLPMRIDEGLAGWVIQHRVGTLVPDVRQDERWIRVSDGQSDHRSALVAPLMVGEDVLGVLMLFHRSPDHFSTDDMDLVQATAKQIAVAINNSKLYRLIRDQAERLGDMLRTQHIEMSRSQAILEAVADGVLVTDSLGQITLFNASAERVLELKRSQVQSKPLESFTGLFGKEARSWMNTIHTWSRKPDSYQEGDVYAEQLELDDGRVVSVHLAPVRLRSEFLGTVSIFRDITHEVEVDRLKSEFVANVSHELRTPMTSIKGYVDILLMGATGDLSEQQRAFLNVVKSNTERLVVLVNDLLEVSRLEAGKINLSIQPIDLQLIAADITAELHRRSERERRPVKIKLDARDALPLVLADGERVRQIIDNLVDNAYHYTPAGGKIVIRLTPGENEVQVDVQDNGIGIPLADQAQIFDRFYRGEDPLVLETPGTGLGLAVVKNLVEMHHGRIWVYSTGRAGDGSVFSFTLPAANGELAELMESTSFEDR